MVNLFLLLEVEVWGLRSLCLQLERVVPLQAGLGIDLLYAEDGRVVVADYKTDRLPQRPG